MDWIVWVIIISLVVLWFLRRDDIYKKIFADQHFVEFAERLVSVKAAALERIEEETELINSIVALKQGDLEGEDLRGKALTPHAPDDPRILRTSADLVLVYTINQEDETFVHYYSISIAGNYTAGAVGETFSLYTACLFGLQFEQLNLGRSETPVFHNSFYLNKTEHEEFIKRQIEVPSLADVTTLRAKVREWSGLIWNTARHSTISSARQVDHSNDE